MYFNKVISLLTAFLFLITQANFVFAQSVKMAPGSGATIQYHQVGAGAEQKNTPVINIETPNSKGISHNKYEKFNVDKDNLILNNSKSKTTPKLFEDDNIEIDANPNLTGNEASLIINEVMTGNISNITGILEIAGKKADVIIANPWGININGGSFINTGNLSFITGNSFDDNGTLKFSLSKNGVVNFQTNDFEHENSIEIVSRYTKISKKLKAKTIDIKAGYGDYTYKEDGSGQIESKDALDAPADKYAVEATAFGSMYGNRIKIVSTEEGFGVKTASESNLVSSVEDIIIEAEENILIQGNLQSNTDITLSAKEVKNEGGEITAENDINITADSFINTAKADNISIIKKPISVNSALTSDEQWQLISKKVANIKLLHSYEEFVSANFTIKEALLKAGNNITITALNLENLSSSIITGNTLKVNADYITNSYFKLDIPLITTCRDYFYNTTLWMPAIQYTEIKDIANYYESYSNAASLIQGGNISISGKSDIFAESVKNYSSQILATNDISIKTKLLDNSALVMPNSLGNYYDIVTIQTGNHISNAAITLMEYQDIKWAYSLKQAAAIESSDGKIEIEAEKINNISSKINAKSDIFITTDYLNNEVFSLTVSDTLIKTYIDKTQRGWGGSYYINYIFEETPANYKYFSEGSNLAEASLINGSNIIISGLSDTNTKELSNIASNIKASGDLDIYADNIINEGLSNTDNTIKRTTTYDSSSLRYLEITNAQDQTGVSIHTAQAASLEGINITITASDIFNKSALIKAANKLDIYADNLTNTTIMFEEGLDLVKATWSQWQKYDTWGQRKMREKHIYIGYREIYTFTSTTFGEILGNDININLTGIFNQEEFTGALQRLQDDKGNVLFSRVYGNTVNLTADEVNNSGQIKSEGNLNISAQNSINNIDGMIAGSNVYLEALDGDFTAKTTLQHIVGYGSIYYLKTHIHKGGQIYASNYLSIFTGNSLFADYMSISSGGNLELKITNSMALNGIVNKNTTIVDYQNYRRTDSERAMLGILRSEGDMSITGDKGNMYVKGYMVRAGGKLYWYLPNGSLDILSMLDRYEYELIEKVNGGFLGLDEYSRDYEYKENHVGSSILVNGPIEIIVGNNINILASTVESLTEVMHLTAGMDINLLAGENYEEASHMKMSKGVFGLSYESEESVDAYTTAAGSKLKARKLIMHSGNDINILGSDIEVAEDAQITAGGNINVMAVDEKEYHYHHKESRSLDLLGSIGDFFNSFGDLFSKGQAKMSIASYSQSEDSLWNESTTGRGSNLDIGGNLILNSSENTNIIGSNILADSIEINAATVNILSYEQVSALKQQHKDMKITVSLGLTNSYVDAYLASDALVKAGEIVAKAEEDLNKAYELHKQGKISGAALQDYKTNLTLATANLAAAGLNAAASIASAAKSASTHPMTGGFNASVIVDTEVNESTSKENITTNLASSVVANKDINITASNDINQTGSHVTSLGGDISYEAGNNVNIQASKDFYETSSNEQSYNASISYGTGGMSGSAGFSLGNEYATDIVHNNSTVEAQQGKISIKTGTQAGSEGDLNIKGGVVYAKNVDIDVKGDLNIESVQDTHRKESKNVGANISISGTEDKEVDTKETDSSGNPIIEVIKGGLTGGSIGGNYGQSKEDGAWVGQQSAIIGSESVDIEVGETLSNKGAVIANADYIYNNETGKMELGNDKGNLVVKAKEFVFEDIKDHYNSSSYNYGMSASFGQVDDKGRFIPSLLKSTRKLKFTFLSKGYEKEQINRATAGKGDIFVDGVIASEEQLAGLNRDVTISQEITKDLQTAALDAELTLDLRLLTSSGRKEIWDQLTGLPGNVLFSAMGITQFSVFVGKVGEGLYRGISGQGEIFESIAYGKKSIEAIMKMDYDKKNDSKIASINNNELNNLGWILEAYGTLDNYLAAQGLQSATGGIFITQQTNGGSADIKNNAIFLSALNSSRDMLKVFFHESAHINGIESESGAQYAGSFGTVAWDIANFFGLRSFADATSESSLRFTNTSNPAKNAINTGIIARGNQKLINTPKENLKNIVDPSAIINDILGGLFRDVNYTVNSEFEEGFPRGREAAAQMAKDGASAVADFAKITGEGAVGAATIAGVIGITAAELLIVDPLIWFGDKLEQYEIYNQEAQKALNHEFFNRYRQEVLNRNGFYYYYDEASFWEIFKYNFTPVYIASEHTDYFVHSEYYGAGSYLMSHGDAGKGIGFMAFGFGMDALNISTLALFKGSGKGTTRAIARKGEVMFAEYIGKETFENALKKTATKTSYYRYITEAELKAIDKSGGFLRGGNPGEVFFTKDLYKTGAKAQSRLSLGTKPTLRVEFEIENNPILKRIGSKVLPDNGQIGKGSEFMTTDKTKVKIINIQPLLKGGIK